jgi:hypothetical protein
MVAKSWAAQAEFLWEVVSLRMRVYFFSPFALPCHLPPQWTVSKGQEQKTFSVFSIKRF